jgi:indole-3-glycerol phosphate synthase
VLVEAHSAAEVERAVALGARIVGVNARDLATFDEHLDVVEALVDAIPPEVIAVAESAIRSPEDAARMAAAGFDAVLVGEALVRSADPAALVGALGAPTVKQRGSMP